jgi:hypothetical protein
MNSLQYAYDKFRKEYTLGKGASREDVEMAFKDRMKQMQTTPMKGPNPNSPEFKLGGRYDVNSARNRW